MYLTASNQRFPNFIDKDRQAICLNVAPGDIEQEPDPYFQWQGTYWQVNAEGIPLEQAWTDGLQRNANDEGVKMVKEYCKTMVQDAEDMVFHSPAKSKMWGIQGPNSKPTNHENLLIKRSNKKWFHVELSAGEGGEVMDSEFELQNKLLKRITYPYFFLETKEKGEGCEAEKVYGTFDPSEAAWLWGSSMILLPREGEKKQRMISKLPNNFDAVRHVPMSSRADFMRTLAETPTAVITGATLDKDSEFASKLSSEIAKGIGKNLGMKADKTNVKVCINASMRGHSLTMSADDDFSTGFEEEGGKVVNVKGSNMVQLHGDAWKVGCGVSYILEEDSSDFSNNAKEACLCAAAKNPGSIVMVANGGQTVSINLVRFLKLSSCGVFAINGMHGKAGKSGAAGSFKTTPESLNQAVATLKTFGPQLFTDKDVVQGDNLFTELSRKPLTLLDWSAESKQCNMGTYTLQPGLENKGESPGIEDEGDVDIYCKTAVQFMVDKLMKA